MDSDQTKKKYYKKEELYNTLLRRLSTPLLKLILKTNLTAKEIIILILGSIAAINSGIIELSINDKRNAINNYLGDSEKIKEDFLKNYLRIKTIATEAYLFFFSFGIIIFSIFGILNSWILLLVVYSTIYLIGKVFYEYTNL